MCQFIGIGNILLVSQKPFLQDSPHSGTWLLFVACWLTQFGSSVSAVRDGKTNDGSQTLPSFIFQRLTQFENSTGVSLPSYTRCQDLGMCLSSSVSELSWGMSLTLCKLGEVANMRTGHS